MARSFISSPQTYEGDTDQAVYAGLGHAAQRNAKFTGYLQPELNAERRVGGPPKVRRVEPPKSSPHYVNYLTIANPVRCYRVAKNGDRRCAYRANLSGALKGGTIRTTTAAME